MMLELNNYYIQELENLTDLFTNIFVIIDDIYNEIIPIGIRNRRNIKDSKLSDSEIITISIVGELLTIDSEKLFFSLLKKEYKEYYRPKNKPEIINIPSFNYIAVRGKGNPNEKDGAYQQAIGVLYAVAYTLKMSYKTEYKIEGFFEYVVPPLEGFWWQDDVDGIDYSNKDAFNWISVIRLPDFITKKDFDWAVETATKKKKLDCSLAEFITIEEGLCVQIMHFGAFDDEPATVEIMDTYLRENGYKNDLSRDRLHHEIYLSDARKVAPEKWKTVIRHPISLLDTK